MTVYVSMLRGVNVGGNALVGMADLKRLYESLGLRDVRTLLNSGNVVFRSSVQGRAQLTKRLVQEIERRFNRQTEVLLRTLPELAMLVERGPTLTQRQEPSKLLVMFLSGVPDKRAQAALIKAHRGPELIEIRGPEIYLYYPDGVGRSKLTNAFIEAHLGVSGTARNWNTIRKLIETGESLEGGGPQAAAGAQSRGPAAGAGQPASKGKGRTSVLKVR
ncbi:MAG TPA: DUF1697 domain-containing protein [Gammaproteobacteria bacterium]|nr:DUF1697 domain-containing protein [Gammaproteobacteria bacterium]